MRGDPQRPLHEFPCLRLVARRVRRGPSRLRRRNRHLPACRRVSASRARKGAMAGEGAIARIEGRLRRPGEPPGITGMWSATAGFPDRRLAPVGIGVGGSITRQPVCRAATARTDPVYPFIGRGTARARRFVPPSWRSSRRSRPGGPSNDPARPPRPLVCAPRPHLPRLGRGAPPLARAARPATSRRPDSQRAAPAATTRTAGTIGGAAGLTMDDGGGDHAADVVDSGHRVPQRKGWDDVLDLRRQQSPLRPAGRPPGGGDRPRPPSLYPRIERRDLHPRPVHLGWLSDDQHCGRRGGGGAQRRSCGTADRWIEGAGRA